VSRMDPVCGTVASRRARKACAVGTAGSLCACASEANGREKLCRESVVCESMPGVESRLKYRVLVYCVAETRRIPRARREERVAPACLAARIRDPETTQLMSSISAAGERVEVRQAAQAATTCILYGRNSLDFRLRASAAPARRGFKVVEASPTPFTMRSQLRDATVTPGDQS